MKTGLLAAFVAITAGQANALSCTTTSIDPVAAYKTLSAGQQPYEAVTGQLRYPTGQVMPQTGEGSLPAEFVGKRLTPGGFTQDIKRPAQVNFWCHLGDCGHIADGAALLLFVPANAPTIVVETGACGSANIWDPSQDALDRLTSCAQGGVCLSQPLQ